MRPKTLLAITLLVGCADSPPPPATPAPAAGPPWFVEAAATRGIDFIHDANRSDRFELPEIMCGGGALLDVDGDGDLDAYLVQGGDPDAAAATRPGNRLYRNTGDGRFEDATAGSGADDRGYGMGVAAGDFDNDGDVDLYVTNVGVNTLLRNDGDWTFTDVTAAAGVGDGGWGAGAAFLDYDRDGDLDLFATNYLIWTDATRLDCYSPRGGRDYCSPQAVNTPAVDILYRNGGDGTFTDVTDAAGLGDTLGTGLGVIVLDFDGDGWSDLFVANDGMPDRLWMNRGDGTFEDRAMTLGCAVDEDGAPKAGMGVAVGDLDEDGRPDLMVGNLAGQTDSLYMNRGTYAVDATARAGIASVSRPFTRFGMAWTDLDNDGRLDLLQVNGRVVRHEKAWADDIFAEPNLLYRGVAGNRFEPIEPDGGTDPALIATSRAAAFGDVDGDGGVDVLVVNNHGPAHLLMNAVPGRGHWITLDVRERHGGPALGARVSLQAGPRTVVRDVRSAYSYLSANDPRVHVGLGDIDGVSEITVRWVDGVEERFEAEGVDRVLLVQRDR